MGTHSLAADRSARGMTLLEVLAAVFCLGMGLIMVAGAFPAGAHQTRLTIEQTDASMMAKSAMEYYIHQEQVVRKVTQSQWRGIASGEAASPPMTIPLAMKDWCVWNPDRLAYLENWSESRMLPPGGGDFIMRGFLTRVSANDEAPLFRLTVVVCRYNNESPDLYDTRLGAAGNNPATPADNKYPPGVRYLLVTALSVKTLTVSDLNHHTKEGSTTMYQDPTTDANTYRPGVAPFYVTGEHYFKAGDMVMDTSTGFCYATSAVDVGAKTITLVDAPAGMPLGSPVESRDWFIFRDVIGVYYRLVH